MSDTPASNIPAPPPAPAVGARPASPMSQTMDRRRFISWMGVAWVSFAAATGGALSIVLRYLFPNVVFEPPTSFKAGFPGDYETGVVDDKDQGIKDRFVVGVKRAVDENVVLVSSRHHRGSLIQR